MSVWESNSGILSGKLCPITIPSYDSRILPRIKRLGRWLKLACDTCGYEGEHVVCAVCKGGMPPGKKSGGGMVEKSNQIKSNQAQVKSTLECPLPPERPTPPPPPHIQPPHIQPPHIPTPHIQPPLPPPIVEIKPKSRVLSSAHCRRSDQSWNRW